MCVCVSACVRLIQLIIIYDTCIELRKKKKGGEEKRNGDSDSMTNDVKKRVPSVFHRFFHEKGHKEGSPKEYLSNFSLDFFPSFSLPLILYFIYPINASIPLVKGCVLKELFRINVFFFLPFFFFSNSPLRGELSTFELSRSAVLLTY